MIRIALALCALLVSSLSAAAFDTLGVQFSPHATQYTKGDTFTVTATTNGTNPQYRFVLEKIDVGVVNITTTSWSSSNSLLVDTWSVNIVPGKYRLKVSVRESARLAETLVKTEIFTVVAPAVSACDSIDGKTYTNATWSPIELGNLSLAQILAGINLQTSNSAFGLMTVSFDSGAVSVEVASPLTMQVCTFICISAQATPDNPITGTYTCTGNTVTISATGTSTPDGSLAGLLGASSFPLSVTGNLTIDTATDSLTAGGKTFE